MSRDAVCPAGDGGEVERLRGWGAPDGARVADDVTAILAGNGLVGSSMVRATWTLPSWPVSVTWARHLVRGQLLLWSMGQACDVAELLASELVTNAVRHAAGLVLLTLWVVDGVLRCEVGDGSQQLPVLHAASDDDEGWRGLALVEELSQAWGSARTRWGKVVWFELELPCATGPGREVITLG
ncbi:ATP-binding protein [Nonomuraea maritima]|uniref:ATP-binding protein n=1 Tax=Nonomuraea maritima TaxID=683260 RepID=UPI003714262E